jgi:hypothetical protein
VRPGFVVRAHPRRVGPSFVLVFVSRAA